MNSVIQQLIERYLQDTSQKLPSNSPPTTKVAFVGESTASKANPSVWWLQQYMRYLPIAALIRDIDGRTIMANAEFKELVGLEPVEDLKASDYWGDPDTARLIALHDQVVRDQNSAIFCVERILKARTSQARFVIRFPIRDDQGSVKLIGAFGFDLEKLRDAEIMRPRETGRRPCRIESARPLVYGTEYSEMLLADFARSSPAIMVAKSPMGYMRWANPQYYSTTGKGTEVLGRLTSENWPPEISDLIIAHDQLVRETRVPFLSVETLAFRESRQERLTLRFPILESSGEMEMIGVLGFPYSAIKQAINELAEPGASKFVYLYDPDGFESLRLLGVNHNSAPAPVKAPEVEDYLAHMDTH